MDIKYHEKEGLLEIKDGLRTVYLILKMVMFLNITIAIANLYRSGLKQLDLLGYLYIVVGFLSMGVLVYMIIRKSTDEIIPLDKINRLREKSFFGKSVFSLELKNGKVRDLSHFKTKSEISELVELFVHIGISSKAV